MTIEDRVKAALGEYAFTVLQLQQQLENANSEVERLKKEKTEAEGAQK